MASSTPALAIATLLLAAVSSQFPSKSAADDSPECPYPCLPPPTSVANCPPPPSPPPPPPSEPSLPCPPPPPQPYTPGYLPPPSSWVPGNVPYYPPPQYQYPAPPPPNPIMPYFPYYYRSRSAPTLRWCCLGSASTVVLLHLIFLGFFLS